MLLIHAIWTIELEIRLDNDIPEAVLNKILKNSCESIVIF